VSYVVKNFEPGLWTVGHYQPDGKFDPEADYADQVAAGQRCHFLNGGTSAALAEQLASVTAERDELRELINAHQPTLASQVLQLRRELADLRTSLDYAAGQWESNAMPHTHPTRSGEYRKVMADCARDLRYALKANAPDAVNLRELVAEILADFWPGERFEGISEGLRDAQARVDDYRKRAGLERQS